MHWVRAETKDGAITVPGNWLHLHYYEAFSVLFRVENALRLLVYVVLKDQFQEKWPGLQVTDDTSEGQAISTLAKKRRAQDEDFGYLGYPVTCPLLYLTGGELARLITTEKLWTHFKPYFPAAKELLLNKLEGISNVRNSLAHFRAIPDGDVEVVKQNASQMLRDLENTLGQLANLADVVPTNTTEAWYRALVPLSSPSLRILQSQDEAWIGLRLLYNCPIVSEGAWGPHRYHRVLNLISPALLSEFAELRNRLIYLSESVSYPRFTREGVPTFGKSVILVFGRKSVQEWGERLAEEVKGLLLKVEEETELIRQDNLARGAIIRAVECKTTQSVDQDGKTRWNPNYGVLYCPITKQDPPEYWGNFSSWYGTDIVSDIDRYPWMPVEVSPGDIPF